MDTPQYKYTQLDSVRVELLTQQNNNFVVLRGRTILNEYERRLTFVQNPPRGPRSVEVARTAHSRLIRRCNGMYTLTFRFDSGEKYISSALQAEVRAAVKKAQEDRIKLGRILIKTQNNDRQTI